MRWLILLVLALSACGTPLQADRPSGAPVPPTVASAPTQDPASTPPASTPPESTPPALPAPSLSALACDDEIDSGSRATIMGQQEAFARGDFDSARSFASQGFQATVSQEQFALIITESYAFLLDDPEVEILQCATIGEFAQVIVRTTGAQVAELSYRLVREEPGWRIDGASVLAIQNRVAA